MNQYTLKAYQEGYEKDQARIGIDVAREWIWPYAYDYKDLMEIHSRPDFDPDTRHYCFMGDEMVGYMFTLISPVEEGSPRRATLDFPRMAPGHEDAAELLVVKALDTLKEKGVERVTGHITTMCPGNIRLAKTCGFSIYDWGYKKYYTYEMGWGRLNPAGNRAVEINPNEDLDVISEIASKWYKRPAKWCHTHLSAWHAEGLITHTGVRRHGEWIAACMAAPNSVRPSTAAIFYIFTPDALSLQSMLVHVVNKCFDYGKLNVIADLINEHLQFEPAYQDIGFKKAADWAHCELILSK